MINIFVTYRCNLSCSYCFARELREEHPGDMQEEAFRKLLQWMQGAALPAAAFIGGEPTLHRWLSEMIEMTADAGVTVALFTNGLFPCDLADRLARSVSNFVINFNDPLTYAPEHRTLLYANLSRLAELGARITFSKNFSSLSLDYDYLLDGAARFGVRSLRYDISRPSGSAANDYVSMAETRRIMPHIVAFVRECEAQGIRTGLDCCLRLCDMSVEDRRYMEQTSMKLTGICHPSIDIHPDLSASYCLPMRHVRVPDVTRFANSERLMDHFAAAVRPARFEKASAECRECPDFKRFCQGGCMALKRHSPVAAFRTPEQAVNGVDHERC
jgi:radical SAM protein with 4Fe4S-binding SPASM domain